MRSVTNLLLSAVNDYLTEIMQNELDESDPTRAGMVRPGLLQDDPTKDKVNILSFPNDPDAADSSSWRNEIVADKANGGEVNPPPYEIGGGEMWYRRFTTQLELFFRTKVKRDEAREYASIILSRAELAIARASIWVGTDDFGEEPLQLRVMASSLSQGGGDGQFIWHGKIWWQVLTGKNL
jgi:hypothetical protein